MPFVSWSTQMYEGITTKDRGSVPRSFKSLLSECGTSCPPRPGTSRARSAPNCPRRYLRTAPWGLRRPPGPPSSPVGRRQDPDAHRTESVHQSHLRSLFTVDNGYGSWSSPRSSPTVPARPSFLTSMKTNVLWRAMARPNALTTSGSSFVPESRRICTNASSDSSVS